MNNEKPETEESSENSREEEAGAAKAEAERQRVIERKEIVVFPESDESQIK